MLDEADDSARDRALDVALLVLDGLTVSVDLATNHVERDALGTVREDTLACAIRKGRATTKDRSSLPAWLLDLIDPRPQPRVGSLMVSAAGVPGPRGGRSYLGHLSCLQEGRRRARGVPKPCSPACSGRSGACLLQPTATRSCWMWRTRPIPFTALRLSIYLCFASAPERQRRPCGGTGCGGATTAPAWLSLL